MTELKLQDTALALLINLGSHSCKFLTNRPMPLLEHFGTFSRRAKCVRRHSRRTIYGRHESGVSRAPKRDGWVDAGGAARGKVTCRGGHNRQEGQHARKGHGIRRGDTKEQAADGMRHSP